MERAKIKSLHGFFPIIFLTVALFLAGTAHSATILEFLTPTPDSSPTDLAFDREGNLWFTEINGNKIGKLIPSKAKPGTSEGVFEFPLPKPNSKPHNIIVARDGMVWFSEMAGNRVGSLNPATGEIKEFSVPTPNSEPHHLAEGAKGEIWIAEFETNKIARLNPGTGKFIEIKVNEGHPHDLIFTKNDLWYSQGGKFWAQIFFNKIGRLRLSTGKLHEIAIPTKKSVPHGLTTEGDSKIWFTELFANKIASLDFSTDPPVILEYLVPGERKRPHDLVVDEKRGWVWFTENRGNNIGRLDLSKAQPGTSKGMEEFKVPTSASHPHELVLDSEGNVWFTEMGIYFRGKFQNKIGKLIP